jgi:hypothetical protein
MINAATIATRKIKPTFNVVMVGMGYFRSSG